MPERYLRLGAIATVAGAFSGLFGVGGGSLIVPLLVIWLAYAEREAAATALAAIAIIAALGAAIHGLYGNVDPVKGLLIGAPAIVGVLAGTALQQRISAEAFSVLFVIVLVASAALLVF